MDGATRIQTVRLLPSVPTSAAYCPSQTCSRLAVLRNGDSPHFFKKMGTADNTCHEGTPTGCPLYLRRVWTVPISHGEALEAPHERPQRRGDRDGAVGFLIVLEDR